MDFGYVFLFGDFNSRTKNKPDYIENDAVHDSVSVLSYSNDDQLTERINPDVGHNEYGTRLLSLCKATGVRIVNGRHKGGYSNDFTFNGARGLSTIDYLLTTSDMFDTISKYIVGNFTMFSDHTPLHIELHCFLDAYNIVNNDFLRSRDVFKWDSCYLELCKESLFACENISNTVNFECITSQDELDERLQILVNLLDSSFGQHFKLQSKNPKQTNKVRSTQRRTVYLSVDDKPWFDGKLKSLYKDYVVALRKFNSYKCNSNHADLLSKKRIYKKHEAKAKRIYKNTEGDQLSLLKQNNPKQFFAKFKKRSKTNSNISLENFYEHFKSIASTQDDGDIESGNEGLDINCIFEELDKNISIDEIKEAIGNLKPGKSHGEDGILNEYFIEFQDYFLPILHNLFNCILNTGIFPSTWSSSIIIPVFKKGDSTDPNNYRGISLVSNMCKLFTSILNKRLLEWSTYNDVITDAQFGFKPSCGTRDAIFALHSIISNRLVKRRGYIVHSSILKKRWILLIDDFCGLNFQRLALKENYCQLLKRYIVM